MLAALLRIDTVHKRNCTCTLVCASAAYSPFIIIQVPRQDSCHLPAGAAHLISECGRALGQEEPYKLLKGVGSDRLTVPSDLDLLATDSCQLICASLEDIDHIL